MTTIQLYEKAAKLYTDKRDQQIYVRGFLDSKKEDTVTDQSFFRTLAEQLRPLWPAGEKDGKYPWRDSVENLTIRLKLLWEVKELKNYTLEECLTAARRYLNNYSDNVKYMKTLKYFILRQNERVVGKDGKIHFVNQSSFADMLTSQSDINAQEEWLDAFEETSINYDQGELI